MFDKRKQKINSNQIKLDRCDKHDFLPVLLEDNTANFYRCTKCGGLVDAVSGLRYCITGDFDGKVDGLYEESNS